MSPKRLSPWASPEVPLAEPSSETKWKFNGVTDAQVASARANSRCHAAVAKLAFSVANRLLFEPLSVTVPSGMKLTDTAVFAAVAKLAFSVANRLLFEPLSVTVPSGMKLTDTAVFAHCEPART